jgi:hypothetical protein
MSSIPFLKKKIGHSYLVWFQNSNLYLQFEEPAWFVFRRTRQRYKTETIARAFAARYGASFNESLAFVEEIRMNIQKMNQMEMVPTQNKSATDLNNFTFNPYSTHRYKLGDQIITFSYESLAFEYYIHPLIVHLETAEAAAECPVFELFAYQGSIVFRFNGEVQGNWGPDETHLVKGLIFMILINVMYQKTTDDWLMTVHASAITNGKKTILFSAAPGNGKTTMAALLQSKGYQLISDDFVPIDRNMLHAYPFPIAMSVKEGSMDLLASHFPTLAQKPLNVISSEKSVRYLASGYHPDFTKNIFPVHDFIFIKYDKSVDFTLEKLDPFKGIRLLLDQSWVAPFRGNAEIFFDRIIHKSFYQLSYSNNEKALEAITNLFDHDE